MGSWSLSHRRAMLWMLVALNVGGILLAGLNTARSDFYNDVEWAPGGAGLEFATRGLAFTDELSTGGSANRHAEPALTIEIALRPNERVEPGFGFIAVVHAGDDASQLLISQWRDSIIVMNGDDYDHRRRSPRLTVTVSEHGGGPLFLVVRSDVRGSSLSIDGKTVASNPDLTLRLPTDDSPGHLVLGNNLHGDSPWRGRIEGFALHRVALDDGVVRHHQALWQRGEGFVGRDYVSAKLAYPFSDGSGRLALDRSPNGIDLRFPPETTFIAPKLFAGGLEGLGNIRDVGVNLLGFVPFGFFLVALIGDVTRLRRGVCLAAAVTVGFTLSFSIELAQAWIPSRSSSPLDLLLNAVGVGLGGALFSVASRPSRPRNGPGDR